MGTRRGEPLLTASTLAVDGRLHTAVPLTVTGGDRLVVTGPNGAGKSTLLAVLAGRLGPTVGHVHVRRGATISFLSQEVPAWSGDLLGRCLLYTSPSPRDGLLSRMPSSA